MSVSVDDIDTLMPATRSAIARAVKPMSINKLGLAMSQIVYANAFYPSLLTATVHFLVEIAFADGEHPGFSAPLHRAA